MSWEDTDNATIWSVVQNEKSRTGRVPDPDKVMNSGLSADKKNAFINASKD